MWDECDIKCMIPGLIAAAFNLHLCLAWDKMPSNLIQRFSCLGLQQNYSPNPSIDPTEPRFAVRAPAAACREEHGTAFRTRRHRSP